MKVLLINVVIQKKTLVSCSGNAVDVDTNISLKRKQEIKFEQNLTEWFPQQNESKTEFESMEVKERNKCLSKFFGEEKRQQFL